MARGVTYSSGVQTKLFQAEAKGYTMAGARHDVDLSGIDVVLMNPPFTKVERGIRNFVNMERFGRISGNEVGLWGHFIPLASEFLKEGGSLGAVLPINVLRGRESAKVREFIFGVLTPGYIVKSSLNYGFSEWAEYRDVLFVAKKKPPEPDHKVKFVILKRDLKKLTAKDIAQIKVLVASKDWLRTDLVDIDSHPLSELRDRFENLMWFFGVSDFSRRDLLVSFIRKFTPILTRPRADYFREGYRPVPKGVSSFMFMTRFSDEARVEEAFLYFRPEDEDSRTVSVRSHLGTTYSVEKSSLLPSLRTGVGLKQLDITSNLDYIAGTPYSELEGVLRASGFKRPKLFSWRDFWLNIDRELAEVTTKVVTLSRINPYSPSTHLVAFSSTTPFAPSNTLNVVREADERQAKAFCVVMNSVIFWTQFFLMKEETTGRHIHIRFYDLAQMYLLPPPSRVDQLVGIYDRFSSTSFPSLREQFDSHFDERYSQFWLKERKQQTTLSVVYDLVEPHKSRVDFDKAVCDALGVAVGERELLDTYKVLVEEMIITRGLMRD